MMTTSLILIAFAVLLATDWRRRSVLARMGAVVLSLQVLWFSQPNSGRAMRQAINLPKEKRILVLPNWGALSDYRSGVLTMQRAMREDMSIGARGRLLGVGVLVWLSMSPAIRRTAGPNEQKTGLGPVA